MSNLTNTPSDLPGLPSYSLTPLPPLIAVIPDKLLTLLLPIAVYWLVSLLFHLIDVYDLFPKYRLHTPAEVLKRNRVSRRDVIRDVLIQQAIQTVIGHLLSLTEPDDMTGGEGYSIARWAQRIRLAQRALPRVLALLGVDASSLAKSLVNFAPTMAGAVAGGLHTPHLQGKAGATTVVPGFTAWETALAQAMYWFLVPAFQFGVATLFVDTWQYFLHRAMHTNRWLYRTFHSRHHRLYVPYAFGALYNHPFEGFLLDSLGAAIAFKVAGLTTRQGMWFFTGSTIKTVDDHCGYALPWDPLQHLTSNNAGYHDVHHQSWGIKTNFSQPFFTFWDRIMGTVWTGGDVSSRYERSRVSAQKQVDADRMKVASSQSVEFPTTESRANESDEGNPNHLPSTEGPSTHQSQKTAASQTVDIRDQVRQDSPSAGSWNVTADDTKEDKVTSQSVRRLVRKGSKWSSNTTSTQAGSLKNLRERVSGSLQNRRGGGVLGMESSRP